MNTAANLSARLELSLEVIKAPRATRHVFRKVFRHLFNLGWVLIEQKLIQLRGMWQTHSRKQNHIPKFVNFVNLKAAALSHVLPSTGVSTD